MHYKVYLILVHKKPAQVKALVDLLDDGKSLFFIHVDKKVKRGVYVNLLTSKACFFVKKRERCQWGRFSLVQATLNGFKEIVKYMENNHPDSTYHCLLLSGEDLPVKTNTYLHSFLSGNIDVSFIHHWKLPYENWWNGGLFRFENFYLTSYGKYPKFHKYINKLIDKLEFSFLLPINRLEKYYPGYQLYGSSQWMVLSCTLLPSLLRLNENHGKMRTIFKHVLAPDELYFITLLANNKDFGGYKVKNEAMHFVKFESYKSNPEFLTLEDVKVAVKGKAFFARKFDHTKNPKIIDFVLKAIKT